MVKDELVQLEFCNLEVHLQSFVLPDQTPLLLRRLVVHVLREVHNCTKGLLRVVERGDVVVQLDLEEVACT